MGWGLLSEKFLQGALADRGLSFEAQFKVRQEDLSCPPYRVDLAVNGRLKTDRRATGEH